MLKQASFRQAKLMNQMSVLRGSHAMQSFSIYFHSTYAWANADLHASGFHSLNVNFPCHCGIVWIDLSDRPLCGMLIKPINIPSVSVVWFFFGEG